MKKSSRCLVCGAPLPAGVSGEYHDDCAKSIFGSVDAPMFDCDEGKLNELARKLVLNRMSVPGVQAKLSVHLERRDGADRLTLVGMGGDWILKLPAAQWPELPESEHFCMMLARRCGIETEDCALIRLRSGALAFLARRMDRTPRGPLHMEDFCQISERLTEEKYRGSLERVGKALRAVSSAPGLDALRLYRVALFCFLSGNSDMHLKNYSILRSMDGTWRLAPAYDLVPVRILAPADPEESALTINGKKANLKKADFSRLALSFGLSEAQDRRTVTQMCASVRSVLDEVLAASFLSVGFKERFREMALSRLAVLDE